MMEHQANPGEKLADSPKRIWLAPACNIDERTWCEDDLGCCDECGEECPKYLRADLVETEIASLRAALDRYRYAVAYCAADAWETSAETRDRFEWARANDPGAQLLSDDSMARIGKQFHSDSP